MPHTKVKAATLPSRLSAKFYLALAALALALLAIPQFSHAQGIVRGAREGSYEGNRVAGPVGGVLAARSAPGSAEQWGPSRACSGFRTTATGAATVAAAFTTVMIISIAIADRSHQREIVLNQER
jgi:hypothetical protein